MNIIERFGIVKMIHSSLLQAKIDSQNWNLKVLK